MLALGILALQRHLEKLGANRILATLTEDTDAIAETIALIPFICIDLAIVIGCLVYLFSLSWLVFVIAFLLLSVAIAYIQFLFSKADSLLQRSREEQDFLFKHFRTITDGIKELKLNFDHNLLAKPVLSNINLDIDRGEIVILTGHSGSGKTTLLTLIGALRSMQNGSLKLFGQELMGATQNKNLSAIDRRNKSISMLSAVGLSDRVNVQI